jgi:hypothetical protein
MDVERKWFCNCTGKPRELVLVETAEDEAGELACSRCGASPSSDPKHTVSFRDEVKPAR